MATKKFPYAEVLVGAFVLMGLAVLFIVIIFLAGKQDVFAQRFQAKAIFSRVAGLRAQSPVRLSGIEVGNVEAMEFNDQGKVVVTMSIQSKYHDQIRKDSTATIGSIGLLGDKTVEITVGSQRAERIPPGGVIPSQDPIDITEVLDRVGPTIEEAKAIMANIAEFTEKLKPEVSMLSLALNSASDILEKVNTGQGTIGALVNDPTLYQQAMDIFETGKKMVDNLEVATQRIDGIADQVAKVTPTLQATLNNFRESSAHIKEGSVALKGSVDQFPALVEKGQKILENIEVAAENVRRATSGFPELVTSSREAVDEANVVLKATQKHWLLRRYVDKEEAAKVVTMDKRDQPYNREEAVSVNRAEVAVEKAKKPMK